MIVSKIALGGVALKELAVPPKNGFRSNDLGHLFQSFSAKALADLGQHAGSRVMPGPA
jgi:hypothetical protein